MDQIVRSVDADVQDLLDISYSQGFIFSLFHKLRFLPLFEEDLNEIVDYITHRLKNPIAAEALISDVQTAIRDRLFCAEAFEQYHSAKERQYPYYRISVRNYTIFYVVIDDVMEVRRIIYSRRDIKHQI